MSDPRYLQRGFDKQLAHVIEECGEVLTAAGKLQRWGRTSINPLLKVGDPFVGETNEDWLRREMVDLQDAIQRLQNTLVLEKP